jgi:hypothetical protein
MKSSNSWLYNNIVESYETRITQGKKMGRKGVVGAAGISAGYDIEPDKYVTV